MTYKYPGSSGGGATAFTDLTDASSVDLPTINNPLATALADNAGGYATGAVHFDGANSSLVNAALSAYDSYLCSFSMWFKYAELQDDKAIWFADVANNDDPGLKFASVTGRPFVLFSDADASHEIDTTAVSTPSANEWHHMLCSVNGLTKELKLYIDDIDVTGSVQGTVDGPVSALNGLSFNLGDDSYGTGFVGDVADFWLAANCSLLQDGDIPEAVRRNFISANGGPVDLGADGSTPTTTTPHIFFHAEPGDEVATFQVNRGTGGSFTVVGSLTAADSAPSAKPSLVNPMTGAGDLIVGGVEGLPERLANPGAGTFNLQSVDGVLVWTAAS